MEVGELQWTGRIGNKAIGQLGEPWVGDRGCTDRVWKFGIEMDGVFLICE
jgi:hypothetical protein